MGKSRCSNKNDLIALRFLSVNSIIDPWVFIFLSPSVQHFLWGALCKTSFIASRNSLFKTSIYKNPEGQIELHQPTFTSVENTHLNKSTVQMIWRDEDWIYGLDGSSLKSILYYIYQTLLSKATYKCDLQCIQVIHFLLSVCVFPGNWTHVLLRC